MRLTRCEGRLLDLGCPRTKSCIRGPFLAHIYYAYTLNQLNYSWKNYIKEYVEATQGADLYLTGPHTRLLVAEYVERSTRL